MNKTYEKIFILSYTFRCIKIVLKIIKTGVYSDFQKTADASIYPPCRVNWRTKYMTVAMY